MSQNENSIMMCENVNLTFGSSHIRTLAISSCRAPTGFTACNSIIRASLTLQGSGIHLLGETYIGARYSMDVWGYVTWSQRNATVSNLAQGLQQWSLEGQGGRRGGTREHRLPFACSAHLALSPVCFDARFQWRMAPYTTLDIATLFFFFLFIKHATGNSEFLSVR
jgi:hypothetical protein